MGTWGEGLYDNDSALDDLAGLVTLGGDPSDVVRLVVQIGLFAWLHPISVTHDGGELGRRVHALDGDLERLPAETRAALETLLADPKSAVDAGSRTPEARELIGGYSDGPRIDALLRFPGAQALIDDLGERAAERLDRNLAANGSLYEIAGAMSALGVLIELAQAGLWQPASERVATWRAGFDAIDKATKSERGFWWKYVRRVRGGFDLLAPGSAAMPAKPRAAGGGHRASRDGAGRHRSAGDPAQAGPVHRFQHPRFGAGILIGRSGTGDDERLELRFEDGQIRKILARFVTPIDG